MQAHVQTNFLCHTHTHIFSRVCRKNVTEEVTLQACPGLDSVPHSDRKHPSDICVGSLSSVPLSFILWLQSSSYCMFVFCQNSHKTTLEPKTNRCCLQQHSIQCDILFPPCRMSGWLSSASALLQKCHGYRALCCTNRAEVHQKYIGHVTPREARHISALLL